MDDSIFSTSVFVHVVPVRTAVSCGLFRVEAAPMASTYDDLALIAPHLSEADLARLRETTASKCAAHGVGVALDEGTGEPLNSASCALTFLGWFFRRTLVLSLGDAKASRSQPF
jgi:hypothetical protein